VGGKGKSVTFRIEHALVMDTDHLRGGGGYSVAAVSGGVKEAERVFVAENFGISDFLHDPTNKRVYFSIFHVPGGRLAFVRRFAHGTRRNGVQSRLFVHTLFIDDELLPQLAYLPWLLLDRPLRLGNTEIFLDSNPEPLRIDGTFPAIEWDGNLSKTDAFEALAKNRFEPIEKRFRQDEELAAFNPASVVAAGLDAIARGGRVVLPQGSIYEQLSMVIWSMLPPADRMQVGWTQHESANTAISFAIANAPAPDEVMDFTAVPSQSSMQVVTSSTRSAEAWIDMQAAMARYAISLRTKDVESWLRFRDARQKLLEGSSTDRNVLIANLREVADSVRLDRRDRWVNEMEVLRFLFQFVKQAKTSAEKPEQAVTRFSEMFEASGIADVVFRVPPPDDLLDEHAESLSTAAIVECFVRGSERVPGAAATRAAVAAWLLDAHRADNVEIPILGRFVERLALDGSQYLKPLLQHIVARPRGLRELGEVLPPRKDGIGDAVLTAVMLGIQSDNDDTAAFIHDLLLPQLDRNVSLRGRISAGQAAAIGGALRNAPDDFAEFASRMLAEVASSLVSAAESWLMSERRAALPLARAILMTANRAMLPGVPVDELALRAAECGEAPTIWLPAVLDLAGRLDDRGDPSTSQQFRERLARLGEPSAKNNADALRQFVLSLRERAAQRASAGVCMRTLVRFTRPWTDPTPLAEAVQIAIANGAARATQWSDIVADLIAIPGAASSLLLTTYWERTGAGEFGAVQPALIEALPSLGAKGRERVVSRWLPLLRTVPDGGGAAHFFDTLTAIASEDRRPKIAIQRSWHEIEHDRADAYTLARLDAALRDEGEPAEDGLRQAIKRIIERKPAATDRAAWLVHVTANLMTTPPSTRRIIERHFLSKELRRIEAEQWPEFLTAAGDDVLVHGNVRVTVAYELALSSADEAVRRMQRRYRNSDHVDALAVLARASRGIIETVAVWSSKGIDRLRGEGRL
jgi:hypothetical protein